MPARVHALVVTRSGESARTQLTRTLDAVRTQTLVPEAVTIVVTGSIAAIRGDGFPSIVEGVVETRAGLSYADALQAAYPRVPEGRAVWLLAQDTVPEPDALELLAGALERSPSAAIAAPKLTDEGRREIVSLGVSMTSLGRTVELAAGELDQGQHDGADDALSADIRGMLIRAEVAPSLRPDPALAGADEGLDLGVRARLAGGRVVLVPPAQVSVRQDGPAALPQRESQRAWATRLAQLHRRLSYAPLAVVPLHWLTLLPLALWRSAGHLIGKRPSSVAPEWAAAFTEMLRFGAVARSRAAIAATRSASWAAIAPLRITRAELHRSLDDGYGSEGGAVSELRFFSGGGAWAVLAALVVSIASFTTLLAWPGMGGGALLPLHETVSALWADAAWGLRGLGPHTVGPADPFAGVIAVLGSLWPGWPSRAMVLLWLLALPLAVLGGWFAATRVTDRSGLRILGGVAWALAPTFLTALVQGRPAAVILHLLLPWAVHAAVVAHRSWGAAGAASLLIAASLACAPSIAPAVVALWAVALILILVRGRIHGAARLIWTMIPAVAMFAPLVWAQLRHGSAVALLADPGSIWPEGPQATADAAGRAVLATGFPSLDLAGWASVTGAPLALVPLLLAPLAVLALIASVAPRWRAGIVLLAVTVTGIGTSFLAAGVVVSFFHGDSAAIWPGSGLSLAWIGLVGAALVALDTALTLTWVRSVAATLAGLALAVCALPALTAEHQERAVMSAAAAQTLPALVAAEADLEAGTLVLTPRDDGALATDVVWGPGRTLGAQTTLLSTATEPRDDGLSLLAVDLLSARDYDAAKSLADRGISFVLLAPGGSDKGEALHNAAQTSIEQRTGFVKAGSTARGVLWRIEGSIAARPGLDDGQQAASRLVVLLQLIAVIAALLLSIPTRASRRAARAQSRIVGRAPEEPAVISRRRDALAQADAEARELASIAGEGTGVVVPASAAAETPAEETASAEEHGATASPASDDEEDRS
ncbi:MULTISPECIES: glycosyltransferase [unclassified Microbacterium]|uniref:glycosyltransferase n=1 Tax=unclassified Microbacterium TaxID=2609290 RepID=UPI0012F74D47|nr:glycosyltransferase [Microbacterium sp. MAH-37]MVQ41813.1 glycosyltransferase [Microbacterium sp. MAH-37]